MKMAAGGKVEVKTGKQTDRRQDKLENPDKAMQKEAGGQTQLETETETGSDLQTHSLHAAT